MKLLHVITRSEWGGAQKIVCSLARNQTLSGHQVVVMCGENGRLVEELVQAQIPVILNPDLMRSLSWRDIMAFLRLRAEARKGYDLIHAHSSKAGILTRLLGKIYGIPVCFTVHGFGVSPEHSRFKQVVYHRIESFWARWSTALIFVSESNRKKAEKEGWLRHVHYSTVIPNGIECGEADGLAGREGQRVNRQAIAREILGIPEKAYVVGNLARLAWIKNPDFWLEVAREFSVRYPNSYFIWFGGGEQLTSYQDQVKSEEIEDRVRFYGDVREFKLALEALDILFLTSHSEGMPLSVLEGMAQGLPVLAPDLPEFKEVLRENIFCGLNYSRGNQQAALDALMSLRDPSLRMSLGVNAQRKCAKEYSLQQMVQSYEKVYEKVMGRI